VRSRKFSVTGGYGNNLTGLHLGKKRSRDKARDKILPARNSPRKCDKAQILRLSIEGSGLVEGEFRGRKAAHIRSRSVGKNTGGGGSEIRAKSVNVVTVSKKSTATQNDTVEREDVSGSRSNRKRTNVSDYAMRDEIRGIFVNRTVSDEGTFRGNRRFSSMRSTIESRSTGSKALSTVRRSTRASR